MPHPHGECAYLTETISISERRTTSKLKSKSVVMQQVSSNRYFSVHSETESDVSGLGAVLHPNESFSLF